MPQFARNTILSQKNTSSDSKVEFNYDADKEISDNEFLEARLVQVCLLFLC